MTRLLLIPLLIGFVYLKAYKPLMAEREYFLFKAAWAVQDREKHIMAALKLDPRNTVWLFQAGQFLLPLSPAAAKDLFESALRYYNGDIVRWAIYYAKGVAALQVGGIQEARAAFETALWYNPEFPEAKGKLEEVEKVLRENDKVLIKIR